MGNNSMSVRLVLGLVAPPNTAIADVEALVKARLSDASQEPVQVIASTASRADAPSMNDLRENMSLFMLSLFPDMMTDQDQNMAALSLMAGSMGSILSFPLQNSEPGTRDGDEAVEHILSSVRRVAYTAAGQIREMQALQEFSPAGKAN